MNHPTVFALGASLLLGAFHPRETAARPPQGSTDTPTYTNVELIAIDPSRRVVVVRSPRGAKVTYDMDDLLTGTASVKPGDRVILTLRGGSGLNRVTAIAKAADRPGVVLVAPTPVTSVVTVPAGAVSLAVSQVAAREAFARQVAVLSDEARSIDNQWTTFVTDCKAKVPTAGDGRAWFGLWDGRVQADYTNGQCRELFNQMVAGGEKIKQGMVAAEDVARKTLTPGEIRDIRKTNLMDWDGWALPAPPKREP